MFKNIFNKLFSASEKRSVQEIQVNKSLKKNLEHLKQVFQNDQTIIFREFNRSGEIPLWGYLIFIDGMVDSKMINEDILRPLMKTPLQPESRRKDMEFWKEKVMIAGEVRLSKDLNELIGAVISGDTVLMIDGVSEALLLSTKGWASRSISEPEAEKVVRGPKEGFTESLLVNLSLVRRRISNSKLKFEFMELGKITKTRISICYIEGIASKEIIEELRQRLEEIEIDGILETGYIEELIKDSPMSPFQTVGDTERPDTVAGKLLEGRVAIFTEGTPLVLTVPYLFMEYFQASEDYYNNFFYASLNRFVRYIGFFFTISVPAIYLSIVTYHKEMIPTELLLSISAAREGVPFPTLLESLIMGLVFEILREAGVRMPTAIGQTASIVGALVLGEAAVSAKLVSAPMVITTALTGICSFLVPRMLGAVIMLRLVFFFLSSILGLYGYIFGVIGLFIHLFSVRSFGIPYMLNLSSLQFQDVKDTIIRAPWWLQNLRPKKIVRKNRTRQDTESPDKGR